MEKKQRIYERSELPAIVENFLNVSNEATAFLENYVQPRTGYLCDKVSKPEETEFKHSRKVKECMKETEKIEVLRSEDKRKFIEVKHDQEDICNERISDDIMYSLEQIEYTSGTDSSTDLNLRNSSMAVSSSEESSSFDDSSILKIDESCDISDHIQELCRNRMSPISQLDGSDDTYHGLAGIASDGVVIPFIINIFRGLEQHWNLFGKHALCTKPKCKSGSRCLFCHLRSVTLRFNRNKYRRRMKPMELESQISKLPSEKEFLDAFPSKVKNIVETIVSYDLDFRHSFIGGNLECASCKTKFSAGLFETIHLDPVFAKNIMSVHDISNQIEEIIVQIHNEKSKGCNYFQLKSRMQQMLLVTTENSNEVEFNESISLFNTTFRVLSFSSLNSCTEVQTTFKFKGDFYTSLNGSIPVLSDLAESQKISVILFIEEQAETQEKPIDELIFKKKCIR